MMCNELRWAVLAVGLISFGASARSSFAVPTVYFDRDDSTALMTSFPNSLAKFNQFTAALNSYGVDTIDNVLDHSPSDFPFQLVFRDNNGAGNITGPSGNVTGVISFNAPTYQIGSMALLEQEGAFQPTANTVFNFDQPINAFGLYVIQGGDAGNSNPTTFRFRNTVNNSSNDIMVQPLGPGWGENNVFFLGVIDENPFNQVEILETLEGPGVPAANSDGMLYDNIVAGTVPEPSSLALFIFGCAGALCRSARSRRC
jgi:hypothetical protein